MPQIRHEYYHCIDPSVCDTKHSSSSRSMYDRKYEYEYTSVCPACLVAHYEYRAQGAQTWDARQARGAECIHVKNVRSEQRRPYDHDRWLR